MRGKAQRAFHSIVTIGITPAYAGKSLTDPQPVFSNQDHPRLCGEKFVMRSRRLLCLGSPPPMRGKVLEMGTQILGGRITPAYAGKRTLTCCTSPAWEDHPRLCGEKEPIEPRELRISGSPPPMRGKAEHFPPEIMRHRITPAYAGKSST